MQDSRMHICIITKAREKWEYSVFSIYSAFQISAEVDTELVIIITISIIQTEFYNKIQIIASL
jgi:hypothetical protein